MKYSIIIPTHNRISLLRKVISDISRSLVFDDVSIIVVNSGDKRSVETLISSFSSMKICHVAVNSKHHWSKAIRTGMLYSLNWNYRYLIWMNDDIELFDNWSEIIGWDLSISEPNKVIVGTFRDSTGRVSYGLKNKRRFLLPGEEETGNYMNGNLVVFPRALIKKLGPLPSWLNHSIGDYLYGLKAIKFDYKLIPSSKFVGICERHQSLEIWQDSSCPRLKRISNLFQPKGLDYFRYARYVLMYDRSSLIRKLIAPFWKVLFK